MLEINGVTLTNEQIVEKLGEKITRPIEFKLNEQFESNLRYVTKGESKWVKRMPESFGLSNQIVSRNFETGGTDTLVYYTHVIGDPNKPLERRYVVGETLNKIEFVRGYLTVNIGDESLLLFLRMHEQCKTNKNWEVADSFGNQKYKPVKSFLFKEIVPAKESEQSYDQTHNRLKAQTAAFDPKRVSPEAAIIMATGYGLSDARYKGEKAVRQFLYEKATATPDKFLLDMNSSAFDLVATVQSAISFNIISFDNPYFKWVKKDRAFGEGRICQVPAGADSIDYFVKWMRETDKSGVMEELKNRVSSAIENSDKDFEVSEKAPVEAILTEAGLGSMAELHAKLKELEAFKKAEAKAPAKKPVGNPNFGKREDAIVVETK